ncbi:rRNA maturation RNase YbeY [Candidatus Uhrbacteria bacterium RIFCSPLOWO2_12_FULL_46_10]|uniref:Endoribonuclease YbeY n=1 Tax=Candidatus Uhrbacteria bacterium RIFCSPLOWO2_01_FULL_47_25 TaxID=1802402 RepID=A0A1F7UWU1_9BACT|nr:MAG: putative rRNA maturation factor [Parcubacteria group bacterium GW2011_GWA2_46_9]OGL60374.1 MAG: rRNA maturation RNase YbeY [Candidatus Uhrbacteria bacterium RIFCSPHIGHO2_01_FULL_46_23]OGL69775.1 MAG: rRNA maturation RNase YbeY [Candidatus Uhrbacteria bacterium RIFCSPHIGHO2_02_FULL_47_29]OGL75367.1 MAG: rRNA maturation RNase YbeY [Candidatus Uhrbacteria bacterium RIFCSPHIGHO2_12_FULL_46_13]OGL82760.1 MAG: rRNA maturation RNase YbeY [Candidatus Uhrbacteria bacterium RIFCSPLOWO2_01_FULL_47
MRLEIYKTVSCRLPKSRLRRLASTALRMYGRKLSFRELSLVIVGANTIRYLNRVYRKKDTPTDVLSFDYGEIIISFPLAQKQAREHNLSVADEIALLFTHGLLHIMGFNHKNKKDKNKMAEAERRLLGYSGLTGRAKV